MGWNPEPDVAALRDFAQRFGRPVVVTLSLDPSGHSFHVTTYGKTRKLCKLAGSFGDQIVEAIQNGTIEPPDVEPFNVPPASVKWTREPAGEGERCHRCGGKLPSPFNYCPSGEAGEQCEARPPQPTEGLNTDRLEREPEDTMGPLQRAKWLRQRATLAGDNTTDRRGFIHAAHHIERLIREREQPPEPDRALGEIAQQLGGSEVHINRRTTDEHPPEQEEEASK